MTAAAPPDRTVKSYAPQADFVVSETPYAAYIGGRGSGKSFGNILKTLRYINEHEGGGGAMGMFTVPRLGDIDAILLPRLRRFWGHLEGTEWVFQEKKSRLMFPRRGWEVSIRPASEPDSCRGPDLAFAAMDEIGTEDQFETFNILSTSVRDNRYPNQLWVTSTPNVRHRWIKQIWVENILPESGEPLPDPRQYPMFHATMYDNPHLTAAYKANQEARWKGTRWGDQELYGQFITLEGLAFPDLSERIHRKDPPAGTTFVAEVTGWDPGVTSPTALLTAKVDSGGRIWFTDEFYKRNATDEEWVPWCGEHNVNRIICDPTGVSEETRIRLSRHYGIRIDRSHIKEFVPRVQFWQSGLANRPVDGPRIFISPSCPNLWEELRNAAFSKPRGHEYATDSWAPGTADHALDAGAYAGLTFGNYYATAPKVEYRQKGWNNW